MRCGCHSHDGFLTERGYELAERERQYNAILAMGLTPREDSVTLDRSGSVSGLVEVEDLYAFVTEDMSDDQYRRFHNGS